MKVGSFSLDGHDYSIYLLDEREDGVDHDPTLLIHRDLDEEAVLTFHPVPGTPCVDHHPVGRPYEEEAHAPRFSELEEDPDAPDDGLVLVAGVLYDAETGEEA